MANQHNIENIFYYSYFTYLFNPVCCLGIFHKTKVTQQNYRTMFPSKNQNNAYCGAMHPIRPLRKYTARRKSLDSIRVMHFCNGRSDGVHDSCHALVHCAHLVLSTNPEKNLSADRNAVVLSAHVSHHEVHCNYP